MNIHLFDKLQRDGHLSPGSAEKLQNAAATKLFSLHWELKTILYLGVLLLSGGLGILVYKNIDTIGHQVILVAIAASCAGCFYYCYKHKKPFTWEKVTSPTPFFDYILLLGCLLFITFITYLQGAYSVFANHYGTATFIPLLVLLFSAYYFDHIGVLSLAITNFAAWLGVNVSPYALMDGFSLFNTHLIKTGAVLGIGLCVADFLSHHYNKKAHFGFTYRNFGTHIFLVACLAGMFSVDMGLSLEGNYYFLWFVFLAVGSWWFLRDAFKHKSFYFLLIVSLYAYVGVSYVIIRLLILGDDIAAVYGGILYFIASAIGLIVFLVKANKKIKHASI
ncbi:DUF2157 domain-containing protein [Chitinophaga sp. sic0106]|uniref:DUF2157 domain-containing protein n=1 Tax=Chitinophaga sp. sic0106 TaxID=2854785 RepID=UPI001C4892F5|nr:DUF2157 domain-containing protein [Chitinophaga sp. sic0106]MBV7529262.1 DUF2157 domain-containing protein [Chitinophaga sp. sic0106]